ncbi:MAG: cytochrome c5 family protein [Gammaproteobacteria bacterium]|nr:cytochrome c5 family protein [Gammaproteobacteria bacterium]
MRVWHALIVVWLLSGCAGPEEGATGAAATQANAGETTYQRFCFSCHASGAAGAPRVGDAQAWAPRIAKGDAAMLASTIEGISPGMPPRGMCLQCSDEDLAAAIDYMVANSQGELTTGFIVVGRVGATLGRDSMLIRKRKSRALLAPTAAGTGIACNSPALWSNR